MKPDTLHLNVNHSEIDSWITQRQLIDRFKVVFFYSLTLIVMFGCSTGTKSLHVEHCLRTTEKASGARWRCLDNARVKDQHDRVRERQMAEMEELRDTCDKYGFKRGTTEFSNCLQQAASQKKMDDALMMQANELNRQNQERQMRKTQCYASGRLDC
ncbi:hypothetical protein MCEMIEM12_01649 [Burkholderiaceae bacterium]|jgi:hypothetical protein